jgi:hypothetical protein
MIFVEKSLITVRFYNTIIEFATVLELDIFFFLIGFSV